MGSTALYSVYRGYTNTGNMKFVVILSLVVVSMGAPAPDADADADADAHYGLYGYGHGLAHHIRPFVYFGHHGHYGHHPYAHGHGHLHHHGKRSAFADAHGVVGHVHGHATSYVGPTIWGFPHLHPHVHHLHHLHGYQPLVRTIN